jgi:hypothetical protein
MDADEAVEAFISAASVALGSEQSNQEEVDKFSEFTCEWIRHPESLYLALQVLQRQGVTPNVNMIATHAIYFQIQQSNPYFAESNEAIGNFLFERVVHDSMACDNRVLHCLIRLLALVSVCRLEIVDFPADFSEELHIAYYSDLLAELSGIFAPVTHHHDSLAEFHQRIITSAIHLAQAIGTPSFEWLKFLESLVIHDEHMTNFVDLHEQLEFVAAVPECTLQSSALFALMLSKMKHDCPRPDFLAFILRCALTVSERLCCEMCVDDLSALWLSICDLNTEILYDPEFEMFTIKVLDQFVPVLDTFRQANDIGSIRDLLPRAVEIVTHHQWASQEIGGILHRLFEYVIRVSEIDEHSVLTTIVNQLYRFCPDVISEFLVQLMDAPSPTPALPFILSQIRPAGDPELITKCCRTYFAVDPEQFPPGGFLLLQEHPEFAIANWDEFIQRVAYTFAHDAPGRSLYFYAITSLLRVASQNGQVFHITGLMINEIWDHISSPCSNSAGKSFLFVAEYWQRIGCPTATLEAIISKIQALVNNVTEWIIADCYPDPCPFVSTIIEILRSLREMPSPNRVSITTPIAIVVAKLFHPEVSDQAQVALCRIATALIDVIPKERMPLELFAWIEFRLVSGCFFEHLEVLSNLIDKEILPNPARLIEFLVRYEVEQIDLTKMALECLRKIGHIAEGDLHHYLPAQFFHNCLMCQLETVQEEIAHFLNEIDVEALPPEIRYLVFGGLLGNLAGMMSSVSDIWVVIVVLKRLMTEGGVDYTIFFNDSRLADSDVHALMEIIFELLLNDNLDEEMQGLGMKRVCLLRRRFSAEQISALTSLFLENSAV